MDNEDLMSRQMIMNRLKGSNEWIILSISGATRLILYPVNWKVTLKQRQKTKDSM